MSDKRRDKRFKREHRERTKKAMNPCDVLSIDRAGLSVEAENGYRVVYRPKTEAEVQRRVDRAQALVKGNAPFLRLPGTPDPKTILFTSTNGTPVPVEAVEMVFNDALLMDAISAWGEDGPLTFDTYDDDLHREIYRYAQKAYAGVEIPKSLRKPSVN